MKKELLIEGMMCNHCTNHVKNALLKLNEVEIADVDLESKKAVITINNDIDDDTLIKIINDLGYELKSIRNV